MVKLTYIQQQVSNVGQKYDSEVFDPALVNIRGRIEGTLGNRYLSWASRMRMFNDEKNNMFRVLRMGRENDTLTSLEAEAAAKYLRDIDSVLLDYSYLRNRVANKETVDLRTQISTNRTSRIQKSFGYIDDYVSGNSVVDNDAARLPSYGRTDPSADGAQVTPFPAGRTVAKTSFRGRLTDLVGRLFEGYGGNRTRGTQDDDQPEITTEWARANYGSRAVAAVTWPKVAKGLVLVGGALVVGYGYMSGKKTENPGRVVLGALSPFNSPVQIQDPTPYTSILRDATHSNLYLQVVDECTDRGIPIGKAMQVSGLLRKYPTIPSYHTDDSTGKVDIKGLVDYIINELMPPQGQAISKPVNQEPVKEVKQQANGNKPYDPNAAPQDRAVSSVSQFGSADFNSQLPDASHVKDISKNYSLQLRDMLTEVGELVNKELFARGYDTKIIKDCYVLMWQNPRYAEKFLPKDGKKFDFSELCNFLLADLNKSRVADTDHDLARPLRYSRFPDNPGRCFEVTLAPYVERQAWDKGNVMPDHSARETNILADIGYRGGGAVSGAYKVVRTPWRFVANVLGGDKGIGGLMNGFERRIATPIIDETLATLADAGYVIFPPTQGMEKPGLGKVPFLGYILPRTPTDANPEEVVGSKNRVVLSHPQNLVLVNVLVEGKVIGTAYACYELLNGGGGGTGHAATQEGGMPIGPSSGEGSIIPPIGPGSNTGAGTLEELVLPGLHGGFQ